ncbi:MAG: hypothetical protein ACE5LS_05895 [Thermoplasmata archaeon]
MKFAPRPVLFALLWGGGFVAVAVLIALTFSAGDLLLLLFPASLFWLVLPFVVRVLWRRFGRPRT